MFGETTGHIRLTLRLEGLCVLVATLLAYAKLGLDWGTFALFFLTPDISFLAILPDHGSAPSLTTPRTRISGQLPALWPASFSLPRRFHVRASSGAPTLALTVPLAMGSSMQLDLLTPISASSGGLPNLHLTLRSTGTFRKRREMKADLFG